MTRDLLKLNEFDPFSEDYIPDTTPSEPFLESDNSLNKARPNTLDVNNEQEKRLKYLMEFTFHLERYLDVPGKKHGIINGKPWREIKIAQTPEQFQQLLDIEAGKMDIKDRNLFIGEVINKYKSKVELFDKELSPDERVQFFEYKQEFMMFINWLEKEAQAPYKKAKKGKQPTTTNIKNLSNYIQTSKDRKGSCLNECIGILKDMKVINDASIYIPGTKVNKFAYWIHALNEFCIINIKEIGNKQSVVDLLRAEFPGLKMSASTMQKSKWEGAFSKDDDDGYKQEIRTIATAYACIKYGK